MSICITKCTSCGEVERAWPTGKPEPWFCDAPICKTSAVRWDELVKRLSAKAKDAE